MSASCYYTYDKNGICRSTFEVEREKCEAVRSVRDIDGIVRCNASA